MPSSSSSWWHQPVRFEFEPDTYCDITEEVSCIKWKYLYGFLSFWFTERTNYCLPLFMYGIVNNFFPATLSLIVTFPLPFPSLGGKNHLGLFNAPAESLVGLGFFRRTSNLNEIPVWFCKRKRRSGAIRKEEKVGIKRARLSLFLENTLKNVWTKSNQCYLNAVWDELKVTNSSWSTMYWL